MLLWAMTKDLLSYNLVSPAANGQMFCMFKYSFII